MKRTFGVLAALWAVPLAAQGAGETQSADQAQQAQTASRVTQAIRAGEDLKLVEGLFGLSTPEYSELARLEGCEDTAATASSGEKVILNWTCGAETTVPGLRRTTEMIFDDGVLIGFSVNPQIASFAPGKGRAPVSSVSARRDLAEKIGAMVAGRQAQRLSALVPVNDYQVARLDYFGGGKFRVLKPDSGRVPVRFKAMNGQELESFVHFDAAGHPVGLTFGPTACANCDEWVRGESQRRFDDRRKRDRRFLQSENNRQNLQRGQNPNAQRAIQKACPTC